MKHADKIKRLAQDANVAWALFGKTGDVDDYLKEADAAVQKLSAAIDELQVAHDVQAAELAQASEFIERVHRSGNPAQKIAQLIAAACEGDTYTLRLQAAKEACTLVEELQAKRNAAEREVWRLREAACAACKEARGSTA